MWNYQYYNGYEMYPNVGYPLTGNQQNLNSLDNMNNGIENSLQYSFHNHLSNDYESEIPLDYNDGLFLNYKSNCGYKYLDENYNKGKDYDSSTDASPIEKCFSDPELNGSSNLFENKYTPDTNSDASINYHEQLISKIPSKVTVNNLNNETSEHIQSDQNFENLNPTTSSLGSDKISGGTLTDSNQNFVTYTGDLYDGWNESQNKDKNFVQMNDTYLWDPTLLNSGYYHGFDSINGMVYQNNGIDINNNSINEEYNVTHDPYMMNYMKSYPINMELTDTINVPYGRIPYQNKAYMSPSMKFPNKMCKYYGVDTNSYFVNQNMDSQYNNFNNQNQINGRYNNIMSKNHHMKNNVNQHLNMMTDVFNNELQRDLKPIGEDSLEHLIYNGNIKNIDLSSIDFINMSDRIWQALRGAGLFKLGNKGRALLKSKISKHLKMYPELRMRTSSISGVRRATTRQLYQLAQICGITSHLK